MPIDTPERPASGTAAAGPPRARSATPLIVIGLVALSPLLFALATGQAWEDFFISFRHSVNLVEGHGLTYQAGERIQGSSSPFAVLLGALACLASGGGSLTGALWILRLFGLAAFGLTAWYLMRALESGGASARPRALVLPLILFALESKSAAFAANGMETPFFVLFLAGSVWALSRRTERWPIAAGLFWAGLMWTRPDGCVYIALVGLACVLFPLGPRKDVWTALLRAALVCAAVYLPWFLFAWAYYGSPIPQTVVAKGLGYAGAPGFARVRQIVQGLPAYWYLIFLPPYAQKGGWDLFKPLGMLLGAAGTLMWVVPGASTLARRASFAALGAVVYLAVIDLNSPWYFPPIFALTIPPLGDAMARLGRAPMARRPAARPVAAAAAILLAGAFAYLWLDYARQARVTTELNEEKNRRAIGLWLKDHSRPQDRVFLECPGIIGYYSNLRMLDYPGLVSPEVTAVIRRQGRGIARAALALEPEWMVLRPHEFVLLKTIGEEDFRRKYEIARVFDRRRELEARLPGRRAVLYDSVFIVLRRRDRPADPAAAARSAD